MKFVLVSVRTAASRFASSLPLIPGITTLVRSTWMPPGAPQRRAAPVLHPPPQVIPATNTSGIFSNFFSKVFPRGFTSKPPTPDDWAFKAFAGCLSRRGYTVTDVTRLK
jgi:hypothetical protein